MGAPDAVDNLVIGGGPAGAMVALELATAGRSVTLLERERGPHHKVCGEFLSGEAVQYLHRAGISPIELGAVLIRSVRLSCRRSAAEAELPFPALSLSRFALDEALLGAAAGRGCNVVRGVNVDQLTREGDESIAHLVNGKKLRAQNAFLATGKHDLRGKNRGSGKQSDLVGFKMHWRLHTAVTRQLREWMELFLFHSGYGGLSLVERDTANLCFVVQRAALRRLGGFREVLHSAMEETPRLRQLLSQATPLWEKPLAVSPIPYGHLTANLDGLWHVGDQFAVIPSFTGDGMSIALHSGALAAQMFLQGESVAAYNQKLRNQLHRGMGLALWFSRAMVSAAGRSLAVPAFAAWPGGMRWIADLTRVPQNALLETNCEQRPHCASL